MSEAEEISTPIVSFPSFYGNVIKLRGGRWDWALTLFHARPTGFGEQDVVMVPTACLSFSPQVAKALHEILGKQLAKYQRDIGTLPSPPTPEITEAGSAHG